MPLTFFKKISYSFCLLIAIVFVYPFVSHAATIQELQTLIDQRKQEKAALDAENKRLTDQINQSEIQAQSLKSTINVLNQNANKIGNDIKSTKVNIAQKQTEIQQLGLKIKSTEEKINDSALAIKQSLKYLNETENTSMLQHILAGKTFADVWNEMETLTQFNESLKSHSDALSKAKVNLTAQQSDTNNKKQQLENYKQDLTVQQKIVLDTQAAKAKVLADTKNQEAIYQKQLQANLERGRQIEQEQFTYESQLQIAIDPSKLPTMRAGVLSWPLTYIKINQRFGATVDAKRLYVSGTHNGVDFKATVGTPVMAVFSGVVSGMGNTDEQKGCYSYGRWVMIKHPNGLSSLYAHLSGTKVVLGQQVNTGDVIGFSGGQPGMYGSGFSTGPHLHLGLFATEGVRLQLYTSSRFCKNVVIPIAPLLGYLDPLAYLPSY